MALGIGSAMKEDLKEEAKKYKDESITIGSAMKEDLEKN